MSVHNNFIIYVCPFQCKVFVDAAVERVSCDFLLPTLCEMDEHVNLSVDFLKSEFIYAIAAAVVGILLIVLVRMNMSICLWTFLVTIHS